MREERLFKKTGTQGGWIKYQGNPVLGGNIGVCFDVSVLKINEVYYMYFSWRTRKSVALVKSTDGIHWSEPEICIAPIETEQHWEDNINRPSVVYTDGVWHMWYTGQYNQDIWNGTSQVFHAVSEDGIRFNRTGNTPVLLPDQEWESFSLMNPSVLWDEEATLFRCWYCAGAQYEPKAIGYAESRDGIHWVKEKNNPVFEANPDNSWEQHKTAGCQVIKRKHDYLLFYIGYYDEDYAQIGMAKSSDGKNGWQRFEKNPIIAPDPGRWDGEACYKPFAMQEENRWILWYNGRSGSNEQIGMALHDDRSLGF